jgi:hypothetical protein
MAWRSLADSAVEDAVSHSTPSRNSHWPGLRGSNPDASERHTGAMLRAMR